MERIGGEVLSDIRDEQEVRIVSAAGHELMTFTTFWRAQEWRRSNTVYVDHDVATGFQILCEERPDVAGVQGGGTRLAIRQQPLGGRAPSTRGFQFLGTARFGIRRVGEE